MSDCVLLPLSIGFDAIVDQFYMMTQSVASTEAATAESPRSEGMEEAVAFLGLEIFE